MKAKRKNTAASALARRRWQNATEADRDQPRRAGLLGGRPATCACGRCPKCVRRARRQDLRAGIRWLVAHSDEPVQ